MTSLLVCTTTMEATTAVRETDAVCADIVQAIADHTETDPLEMTPLATVIDTDALEALVRTGSGVRVTFQYGDHAVDVGANGVVTVDGEEYVSPSVDAGR